MCAMRLIRICMVFYNCGFTCMMANKHVRIWSVIHIQCLHGCLELVKCNGMEHWNGILKWPKLHLKFSQVNVGTLSTCLPI